MYKLNVLFIKVIFYLKYVRFFVLVYYITSFYSSLLYVKESDNFLDTVTVFHVNHNANFLSCIQLHNCLS